MGGELVHGEDVLVPCHLVVGHRHVEVAGARERLVQRGDAQLGVAEGVLHALGGDEVLVVSGVTDERPSRAERLAEVVGHRGPREARLALGAADALGELGRLLEGLVEVALDVLFVGLGFGDGPTSDDEGEVVVGGPRGEAPSGPDVGLEATVHGQPAPVAVIGLEDRCLLVVLLGARGPRDEGVPAVGPDDHPGPLGDGLAALRVPAQAGDPAVLNQDVFDRERLADLGARLGCGVDEDLVEHGPTGCVRGGLIGRRGRP